MQVKITTYVSKHLSHSLAGHICTLYCWCFVCNLWFVLNVRVNVVSCQVTLQPVEIFFLSKNALQCQSYKLFSQLTLCAVEHRIYSIVSRDLSIFSQHFLPLVIKGGLNFYFFTFLKGIGDTQSFLATFCRANVYFALDSFHHHVHIRHRRDYDEQKAVVAV